jgi:Cu/Ag efflux pump CusA
MSSFGSKSGLSVAFQAMGVSISMVSESTPALRAGDSSRVSEVASIGGYVEQYQLRLDPNYLLAHDIPLSMVIDRVKTSTNEVGGRLPDLSGAQYMIRGLGYLPIVFNLDLRRICVWGEHLGYD